MFSELADHCLQEGASVVLQSLCSCFFSVSSLPCFVPFPKLNPDMTCADENRKRREREMPLMLFPWKVSSTWKLSTPLGLEGLRNSLWEGWSPGRHLLASLVVTGQAASLWCCKSMHPAPNREKLTVWDRSVGEEMVSPGNGAEGAHWERGVRMGSTFLLWGVTGSLGQAAPGWGELGECLDAKTLILLLCTSHQNLPLV